MAREPCTRYLRDYVAIPSVNPMQREDIPAEIRGERRYAEHLREELRAMGLDAELIGTDERPSVVAEARVPGAAETLLIASHLDTVPVDRMTIAPFDPRIEGGRLYGRGACDTKAGMAAVVAALEKVLARGTLRRNLVLVGEADEELGSIGARDVLAHLGGRRPDWMLATEPTGLRLVTHHKGIALARIAARGVACHSSDPSAGRNAIVSLSRAVIAIESLASELLKRSDPRLGPATCSVGLVSGGHAPNIVPDAAWLVMDRRLLPGERIEQVEREIEDALRDIDGVELESCSLEKGPLATPASHAAVTGCQRALAIRELPTDPVAVAFSTDAGVFREHDIPGVVLGPGSISEAHTAAEFVEVGQVEAADAFFVALFESEGTGRGG